MIFYKVTSIIYKFYFILAKLFKIKYIYSMYQVFLKSNFNDSTFIFYISGSYGFEFSNYLKNQKQTNIFLDIGANQGLYSLLASKNHSINKVYSFEPITSTYNLLKANLIKNGFLDKCKIYNYGIGTFNKKVKFIVDSTHSGNAAILKNVQRINKNHSLFKEKIINFEELNKLIEFNPNDKIGIKIDTEGSELDILQTLSLSKFWINVTWIHIEMDGSLSYLKKIYEIMKNHNFIIKKKIIPFVNLTHDNSPYYDIIFVR